MKEYKNEKKSLLSNINVENYKKYVFYVNYIPHGLYKTTSTFSGLNKGYYNMGKQYGHWKEYGNFYYYL